MTKNSKLKNAPLQEVILEIRWEGNMDDFGNKYDAGFELAQGTFYERIKKSFPVHKKLTTTTQSLGFGYPIHQYWTNETEWPVIQHGQGVLTINQIEEKYTWNRFRELTLEVISSLKESYNDKITINYISLEYLDAFDINDTNNYSVFKFIESNLQTSIDTKYKLPGTLSNIQINRRYLQEDGTILHLNISDALNNISNSKAVIMVTTASKNNMVDNANFEESLDTLHSICSLVFKSVLEKEFYGSLNQ